MDGLLELGEIGIVRDIPSELTQLTNVNGLLIKENAKLKTRYRIVSIILACVTIYAIYRIFLKPEKRTDHEFADTEHS